MACEGPGLENGQIWILAARSAVQKVRETLRSREELDSRSRILCCSSNVFPKEVGDSRKYDLAVPTSVWRTRELGPIEARKLVTERNIDKLYDEGKIDVFVLWHQKPAIAQDCAKQVKREGNVLQTAILRWLDSLTQSEQGQQLLLTIEDVKALVASERWRYEVYQRLAILSPRVFQSSNWKTTFESIPPQEVHKLYQGICSALGVTHLAINAAIPLYNLETEATNQNLNVLRSPSGITPLFGNFGDPRGTVNSEAADKTLWAVARQNGIEQVFAPLHTMFSRGNVHEKSRILRGFADLQSSSRRSVNSAAANTAPVAMVAERQGEREQEEGIAVVDLYAGIGYFAFSYARAGATLVLCWEINPWSVEGFRRGVRRNGWTASFMSADDEEVSLLPGVDSGGGRDPKKGRSLAVAADTEAVASPVNGRPDLLMFQEDNRNAADRVERLRSQIPPVRHVNCGYLPTSRDSWGVAARVLDPEVGGWIHAHENVAVDDINTRALEVEQIILKFMQGHGKSGDARTGRTWEVKCEHVERIKSYAPGVMHCVFDVRVVPETR